MDIQFYQTIKELGIKGRMDTPSEFEKIQMPRDLSGWTVLDIGCNTGAFLVEARNRGATFLTGIEPNMQWRLLAHGVLTETAKDTVTRDYTLLPDIPALKGKEKPSYDLVMLLSVTHLKNGAYTGQDLLEYAWELTNNLLIVEINDRLQERKLLLPPNAKFIGKNKDNRSVYHCYKISNDRNKRIKDNV